MANGPAIVPSDLQKLLLASDRGLPLVASGKDAPIRGVHDVETPLHAIALLGWMDAPPRGGDRAGDDGRPDRTGAR